MAVKDQYTEPENVLEKLIELFQIDTLDAAAINLSIEADETGLRSITIIRLLTSKHTGTMVQEAVTHLPKIDVWEIVSSTL